MPTALMVRRTSSSLERCCGAYRPNAWKTPTHRAPAHDDPDRVVPAREGAEPQRVCGEERRGQAEDVDEGERIADQSVASERSSPRLDDGRSIDDLVFGCVLDRVVDDVHEIAVTRSSADPLFAGYCSLNLDASNARPGSGCPPAREASADWPRIVGEAYPRWRSSLAMGRISVDVRQGSLRGRTLAPQPRLGATAG